ncbi:MAG: serine hydrolase [Desulfobacteraceae bacterium]|jgi:CubicO group peptidase (beta-lactamase class C family)
MKWINPMAFVLVVMLLLAGCTAVTDERRVPTRELDFAAAGWDKQRLDGAFQLAQKLGSTTLAVMTHGKYVQTMGDLRKSHRVHSVRKALLSALVGQHVGTGPEKIDLDKTLAELGIDDHPQPLTPLQRQATVLHLIKSISGINHAAAAEIPSMTSEKQRLLGAAPNMPGTVWAYNNWDYNALTTVFEEQTHQSVYTAFLEGIARPLGMQDVSKQSVFYVKDERLSRHAKVGFRLSARDLARFGQLYLNKGHWQGRQIIPAAWVARVTTDFTRTNRGGLASGHGYLWWIPCDRVSKKIGVPAGTFMASGFAGQRIVVIPAWDTVIVHTVSTDDYAGFCTDWAIQHRMNRRQAMRYSITECRQSEHAQETFCRRCRYYRGGDFRLLLTTIIAARTD